MVASGLAGRGGRGRGGSTRGRGGGNNPPGGHQQNTTALTTPYYLNERANLAKRISQFQAAIEKAQQEGQGFVARPTFADWAPNTKASNTIYTNHFVLDLPDELYQYRILNIFLEKHKNEGRSPPSDRKNELMKLALEKSTVLEGNQGNYATYLLENVIA